MLKTRIAIGLIVAALSMGIAGTANAVEPPAGGHSARYDLYPQTSDGILAAHVILTWVNGYHGRVEVEWHVTDLKGAIVVDIDGHRYSSNDGRRVRNDGKIYNSVRVRGCDSTYHKCGSAL